MKIVSCIKDQNRLMRGRLTGTISRIHLAIAFILFGVTGLLSQPTTISYLTNGSFTVPACVSSISFTAAGAKGGAGIGSSTGGNGGRVTGMFSVTPGQVLNLTVGGVGANAVVTACVATAGAGGYNGGGSGSSVSNFAGGGGGGATDIRVTPYSLVDRIVVAGGGGGAGYGQVSNNERGGGGGGLTGENGYGNNIQLSNGAGAGGTQTVGGVGGGSGSLTAASGSFGVGGAGSPGQLSGGGGGGGWYGGGAGTYGGGGGGSGYTSSFVTVVTHSQGFNSGGGSILLSYFTGSNVNISTPYPGACAGSSITLSAPAGLSNYLWNTSATTQSITVAPGFGQTYSFTATMTNSCTAMGSLFIVVNSLSPTLSISANTTQICPGKSVSVTASGAQTYTWNNSVSSGVPFSPLLTNTYIVTGQNGCGTASAAITITVTPISVSISSATQSICLGKSGTLTAITPAGNYSWTPFATGIYTGSAVYSPGPTVTTVYSLTASDGTCIGSATYTLNVLPLPTIALVASQNTVCVGSTVTLTASGGISYSWTPSNLSGTVVVVTSTTLVLYSVAGNNTLGCTASAAQVIFTNTVPVVTIATSTNYICRGTSVTLTAAGASSYTWTGGPATAVYQVTPANTSTYTVTGFNTNSCSARNTVTINVYTPTLTVAQSTPVCIGKPVVLTASAADTYSWNGTPGGSTFTIIPLQNSVYTVAVTSTSLGLSCRVNQTLNINPNPNPTLTVSGVNSNICKNDNAVLTFSGASTYSWISSAGAVTGNGGTISVSSLNTGLYNYTVTGFNSSGCNSSMVIAYNVNECTGLESITNEASLTVFPNPAQEFICIRSQVFSRLTIFDSSGQLVKILEINPHEKREISTLGFTPGIYFVISGAHPGPALKLVVAD